LADRDPIEALLEGLNACVSPLPEHRAPLRSQWHIPGRTGVRRRLAAASSPNTQRTTPMRAGLRRTGPSTVVAPPSLLTGCRPCLIFSPGHRPSSKRECCSEIRHRPPLRRPGNSRAADHRDRQHNRAGAGWSHLHREDQRAVSIPRSRNASRIQRRLAARDRTRLARNARIRDLVTFTPVGAELFADGQRKRVSDVHGGQSN
jgi:hypothetical protein